jgi:hypothetical protein
MGAPHFDIIGREKRNLSPNAAAPKEETPKGFDPTSEKSSARENPLESKSEHPKEALTAFGGGAEAEEAIAKGDLENAKIRPEITGNDIHGNTEACTGYEAHIEDSGAKETGLDPAGNRRECAASTARFANPSETSEERFFFFDK